MFADGGCLHATIKDADQYITCLHIKPKNMIHINFTLWFYYEFSECNIPNENLYGGPNASLIHFSVYTDQVICGTHVIIINGTIVCRICEERDYIKNGIINRI